MPVDRRIETIQPENLERYRRVMIEAQTQFYRENYEMAIQLFEDARQIIVSSQIELHHGVHKGDVYYFLGIAELGTHNPQQAVWHTLLAYVEDTLGTQFDFEDDADRAPAGRTLIDGFAVQLRLLREIKRSSRELKENINDWMNSLDPEPILVKAISSLTLENNEIMQLLGRQDIDIGRVPLGFPQSRERRVFIGTNFDTFAHVIPEMRLAIISRNYVPVTPRDVVTPEGDNPRGVSFVLLHTCRRAFIEITDPAGQLFELERARDYDVEVVLLRSRPEGHEAHVSGMISSLGYPIIYYRDMDELRRVIMERLP